jgi:ferritin-like metal-binding protein YciE
VRHDPPQLSRDPAYISVKQRYFRNNGRFATIESVNVNSNRRDEPIMTINTLKDLYIDQLQDIYSANKQSLQVAKDLREAATSSELTEALEASVVGISQGMEQVKGLIQNHDADPNGEFCKGMEGIVKEAKAHAINADIADKDVLDASIITQYQRMAHYGLAGYGTAAAFAERLGLDDDAAVLRKCLDETQGGDSRMTGIAVGKVNKEAVAA